MKTVFVINVDNAIDLITNSSSELFIIKGQTKELVTEMIESVYPGFRSEYNEVKHISEIEVWELNDYIYRNCTSWSWPADSKNDYGVFPGFTFEELYEPESDKPAWNGKIQYRLRNNKVLEPGQEWNRSFVTEENKADIIKRIDPEGTMYFLYSLDENPEYEMQQALEGIGDRYHLG